MSLSNCLTGDLFRIEEIDVEKNYKKKITIYWFY